MYRAILKKSSVVLGVLALVFNPVLTSADTAIISNSVSANANSQNGVSSVSIKSYSNVNGVESSYSYSSTTNGSIQKNVSIDSSAGTSYSSETIIDEPPAVSPTPSSSATSSFRFAVPYPSTNLSTTTAAWWYAWLNQLLMYVEKFI